MKKRFFLSLITLAVIVGAWLIIRAEDNRLEEASQAPPQVVTEASPDPTAPTREELLKLVNEERTKAGVAPLTVDPMLEKSAQWKADDMTNNNYYGYTRPGETIENGPEYLDSLGPNCVYVGENISWGKVENTSQSAVASWTGSQSHYETMVDPEFSTTGFGVSGDKIVQHFCQTP